VQAFVPYTHHSGLGSKIGVSGKSTDRYGTTTYTQFATWAAHTIRCRWPLYGCLKRVKLVFEALATNTGQGTAVRSVGTLGARG
jgi:hypothetical protein